MTFEITDGEDDEQFEYGEPSHFEANTVTVTIKGEDGREIHEPVTDFSVDLEVPEHNEWSIADFDEDGRETHEPITEGEPAELPRRYKVTHFDEDEVERKLEDAEIDADEIIEELEEDDG